MKGTLQAEGSRERSVKEINLSNIIPDLSGAKTSDVP